MTSNCLLSELPPTGSAALFLDAQNPSRGPSNQIALSVCGSRTSSLSSGLTFRESTCLVLFLFVLRRFSYWTLSGWFSSFFYFVPFAKSCFLYCTRTVFVVFRRHTRSEAPRNNVVAFKGASHHDQQQSIYVHGRTKTYFIDFRPVYPKASIDKVRPRNCLKNLRCCQQTVSEN